MDFAWAKSPADHMDQYADLVGSSQGKYVPASMMAQMQRHAAYVKKTLTPEQHSALHKKISAHVNKLLKDDEINIEEANKIKSIYSPSTVKESTQMDIQEKMTETQMKKREKTVKSMKKKFGDFKKRYGERAKEVMYATATKQAMRTEETEQVDEVWDVSAYRSKQPTAILVHHYDEKTNKEKSTKLKTRDELRTFKNSGHKVKGVTLLYGNKRGNRTDDTKLTGYDVILRNAEKMRSGVKEETEQIDERKDFYAGVSPEMTHHKLVDGKPNVPKKIGLRDIHLHHIGTGNPTSEKAQYKVIAVGPKSPLAAKNNLKVGSKIGGTDVNDHMDYGTGGGTVHVHTARPKSHFMDDMNESVQQDQHYCAKHVFSDVYGEGVVVEGQHADPDENGDIEWYTVQFDHGEEVIFTEDVEVMMAEYHNNHSPMNKKAKKAKE